MTDYIDSLGAPIHIGSWVVIAVDNRPYPGRVDGPGMLWPAMCVTVSYQTRDGAWHAVEENADRLLVIPSTAVPIALRETHPAERARLRLDEPGKEEAPTLRPGR